MNKVADKHSKYNKLTQSTSVWKAGKTFNYTARFYWSRILKRLFYFNKELLSLFLIILGCFEMLASDDYTNERYFYSVDNNWKESLEKIKNKDFPFELIYKNYCGDNEYIKFSINGKQGVFNKKGEILIFPIAERIQKYSEGVVAFYSGFCTNKNINESCDQFKKNTKNLCKIGFIKKDAIVIPANFNTGFCEDEKTSLDKATSKITIRWWDAEFHEGLASVMLSVEELKFGYINLSGEVVIPAKFGKAGHFEGGKAPVFYENSWHFIDKKGAFIKKINNKNESEALVKYRQKDMSCESKEEEEINESKKKQADLFKKDGLIRSEKKLKTDMRYDTIYGLKTISGKVLMEPKCDTLVKLKEIYICRPYGLEDNYIGLDKNGKEIFDSRNPKIFRGKREQFQSFIRIRIADKFTFINGFGEYREDRVFDDVERISDDLIVIKKQEKYGIMKNNGEILKISSSLVPEN